MTPSRMKFELIDGSEPAATANGSRRLAPSILDPGLLNDLAEGLEFLHRQLDDTESELDRSREQSQTFEQEARRWRQDASRLHEEAAATRQALDELRQDFDQSRQGSVRQTEIVDRLAAEIGETRAARAHLEDLAAEQQRALLLSLELLKQVNATAPPPANPEVDQLKQELAAARASLEERHTEWLAAQNHIEDLKAALVSAQSPRPIEADATPNHPERFEELQQECTNISQKLQDTEAEVALQNAEVESRGAIIIALENALEEQNASLRSLEERFLAYAEQVQSLQLERLQMPHSGARGVVSKFARMFSPPSKRSRRGGGIG